VKALLGGSEVYMLGLAAVCWTIWKARNGICFEKKCINNPIEILFLACAFMKYWADLYPEITKKMIETGVNLMMKTVMQMIKKETHQTTPTLMIRDVGADAEEDADLETNV
jgi:hypothetical protein